MVAGGVAAIAPNDGVGMTTLSVDRCATAATSHWRSHPDLLAEDACPCRRDGWNDRGSRLACQKKVNATHRPSEGAEANWNWLLGALSGFRRAEKERKVTMRELRRHNHADSAWILVGNTIYDATPYIRNHPGGMAVILRKSGGAADCAEDLHFHSKRAQKTWKQFRVGTLIRSPDVADGYGRKRRDDVSSAE